MNAGAGTENIINNIKRDFHDKVTTDKTVKQLPLCEVD